MRTTKTTNDQTITTEVQAEAARSRLADLRATIAVETAALADVNSKIGDALAFGGGPEAGKLAMRRVDIEGRLRDANLETAALGNALQDWERDSARRRLIASRSTIVTAAKDAAALEQRYIAQLSDLIATVTQLRAAREQFLASWQQMYGVGERPDRALRCPADPTHLRLTVALLDDPVAALAQWQADANQPSPPDEGAPPPLVVAAVSEEPTGQRFTVPADYMPVIGSARP